MKASHNSPDSLIKSEWEIIEEKFHWNITVPANATAIVYIPAGRGSQVLEGSLPAEKAQGVKYMTTESGRKVYKVGSG